jgi:preprotein translocase SecE subunit
MSGCKSFTRVVIMGIFGKVGRVRKFFGETAVELKKTSWPSRCELKKATMVVVAGSMFIGFFVCAADFTLFQVVNLLLDIAR